MAYVSLQGRLYIGARDAEGNPLGLSFVGNVPEAKVSLSTELLEHFESTSGQRLQDLRMIKSKKGELTMTLEDFVADNLALALYGAKAAGSTTPVVGEALPNPVTVGSLYLLGGQNCSAVTVTDSDSPANTLPGGQYSLNAKHGSIAITDKTTGGPYVEPFKVDYTPGARTEIAMFTQPLTDRWLRFEGVNTQDADREIVIDLYRVSLDPIKDFGLIHSELGRIDLAGAVLADVLKPAGGSLGQFGRMVML